MQTSDEDFPLAVGDQVRIISKGSMSFGMNAVIVELPDAVGALPFLVKVIDRPLNSEYPQNPSYFARSALLFLYAKKYV